MIFDPGFAELFPRPDSIYFYKNNFTVREHQTCYTKLNIANIKLVRRSFRSRWDFGCLQCLSKILIPSIVREILWSKRVALGPV